MWQMWPKINPLCITGGVCQRKCYPKLNGRFPKMHINQELDDKIKTFSRYISSKKWIQLRELRLELDNFQCVLCKTKEGRLVCHHLTYVRLYQENLNDLIILCSKCHDRIHRICPPLDIPKECLQSAAEKVFVLTTDDLRRELLKINFD